MTLPDGRSLSAELVKAGLAWPSTRRAGRLASSLAEELSAGEAVTATLGEN